MRWNIFNECRYDRQDVGGVSGRGDRRRDQYTVMEIRGRNGKWLGAWDRRTVRKVGLVVVFEFCPRV